MSDRNRHRSRSREKRQHHNERAKSPGRLHQQEAPNVQSPAPKQPNLGCSSQQTHTLCILSMTELMLPQLQRKLADISMSIKTSMPDQIELRDNMALVKYPSVEVCSGIFNYLQGCVRLGGRQHEVKYGARSEVNVLYDWYCDKCEYKNFARRGKCHSCDSQRNQNCRLNYGSQFVSFNNTTKKEEIQDQKNCSLMIRGQVITEIQQGILLALFQEFAPIKDIRMIRNKTTGGNKDFAFVQLFSPEQAAFTLKKTNAPDFRVAGQRVTVMYSRTRQDDEYFVRPYDKDRRGPPIPMRPLPKISEQTPNYYVRQRQLEIQLQKKRPLITLQQLKEKRQQQLKKILPQQKQMSEQQSQRKKAQQLARQWQKQIKQQTTIMHICPLCKRKFKNDEQMSLHGKHSELHRFKLENMQKNLLAL